MVGQSASKKNGTKRQRNDTRTRKRFSFCLDVRSRSDRKLMETTTALKKQRLFKRTIVDGIELICDLRAGRTTVLDRLFPHVREQLRREEAAKLPDDVRAPFRREQQWESRMIRQALYIVASFLENAAHAIFDRIDMNPHAEPELYVSRECLDEMAAFEAHCRPLS